MPTKSAHGFGIARGTALLAAALALLTGCSHVITHTTPYYENGPTQPEPPQGKLEEGTPVLVIGHEGSYVRVWTPAWIDAYVWDRDVESIWKAKAPAKPKEQPPPPVFLEPASRE